MGVLNCDRQGCDNIMCDRYSDKYGYLCWECYSELVNKKISVSEFMRTIKAKEEENPYTYAFYDEIFPMRH